MTGLGLYLHFPFCESKCPYCDFTSQAGGGADDPLRHRLLAALGTELRLAVRERPALAALSLGSVYFGGGTPSLLTPGEVGGLLGAIREIFRPGEGGVEITLECNPSSTTGEKLAGWITAGVNRISLGVQSFDPVQLRRLGRLHDPDQARRVIRLLRQSDLRSWGIDLIFGGPDSDLPQWRRDLDEAVAWSPPHVSIYGMTLHAGTPLHAEWEQGRVRLPSEEIQRQMFLDARAGLAGAGYEHYEISNYARPGHRSRHNALYWNLGEYLGLGVAAHSCLGEGRSANPADCVRYLEAIESGRLAREAEAAPAPRSRRAERIMLGLRRCDGIPVDILDARIGCSFRTVYSAEIARLEQDGLLETADGRVRLTLEGILLSDTVFETFF